MHIVLKNAYSRVFFLPLTMGPFSKSLDIISGCYTLPEWTGARHIQLSRCIQLP